MALAPGTRLGVYDITAQIGEGGMGQVWRATDTTLGRQVVIKILPDAFAADPERLARFEREAKTLASLNHPHIAAIYGFEKSAPSTASGQAGMHSLVMELVEGEDLSQRIGRGAIPFDEALSIAKQIAEALEAAHEQGIIHRDLKPANIKMRTDGTVKVLDFGLAKAMEPAAGSSPSVSMSPTITTPAMTQAGMILGTAAYMAPEQARGKAVDKRADIWSFGAVLFEMLAGRRPFDGEDMTEVLGAVVRLEPQWDALPATVPARVSQALRLCLRKDPKQRVGDIRDVRLALEGAFEPAAPQTTSATPVAPRRRTIAMTSAVFFAGIAVAALATWALMRPTPVTLQPMRFALAPTAAQALAINGNDRDLVLSADGTHLVYVAAAEGQLMVRAIDQLDAVPLPGITGARNPFLSPDGRWIGFYAGDDFREVPIAGGAPVTLCPPPWARRGARVGDRTTRSSSRRTMPPPGCSASPPRAGRRPS